MLSDRWDSIWVASEYRCIRRSSVDFSEAFCVALGVARPPRNSQVCFCLPAKEAARRADFKRAIARDFVEGSREACEVGTMSRHNSSPVSTRLPSLLGSPQAGGATTLAGQGLHKESPPPMSSSMPFATQLRLPLGCLQRSSHETGSEEPGCKVSPMHPGRLQHHPSAVAVVRFPMAPIHILQLSCKRANHEVGPPPCG